MIKAVDVHYKMHTLRNEVTDATTEVHFITYLASVSVKVPCQCTCATNYLQQTSSHRVRCSNGHIPHIASVNKVFHHIMKVGNKPEVVQILSLPYIPPVSSCNSNTNTSIWCVRVSGCIIVESVQERTSYDMRQITTVQRLYTANVLLNLHVLLMQKYILTLAHDQGS